MFYLAFFGNMLWQTRQINITLRKTVTKMTFQFEIISHKEKKYTQKKKILISGRVLLLVVFCKSSKSHDYVAISCFHFYTLGEGFGTIFHLNNPNSKKKWYSFNRRIMWSHFVLLKCFARWAERKFSSTQRSIHNFWLEF